MGGPLFPSCSVHLSCLQVTYSLWHVRWGQQLAITQFRLFPLSYTCYEYALILANARGNAGRARHRRTAPFRRSALVMANTVGRFPHVCRIAMAYSASDGFVLRAGARLLMQVAWLSRRGYARALGANHRNLAIDRPGKRCLRDPDVR